MVDALDLGSSGMSREGSNPSSRIDKILIIQAGFLGSKMH